MEVFWDSHDACRAPWSTQYKAILFFHDDAQKAAAEKSRLAQERILGRPVLTELRSAGEFTVAEDYHQKYYARHHRETAPVLEGMFPSEAALRDSTLAARLNAYAGGDLPFAELKTLCAELGYVVEGTLGLKGLHPAASVGTR